MDYSDYEGNQLQDDQNAMAKYRWYVDKGYDVSPEDQQYYNQAADRLNSYWQYKYPENYGSPADTRAASGPALDARDMAGRSAVLDIPVLDARGYADRQAQQETNNAADNSASSLRFADDSEGYIPSWASGSQTQTAQALGDVDTRYKQPDEGFTQRILNMFARPFDMSADANRGGYGQSSSGQVPSNLEAYGDAAGMALPNNAPTAMQSALAQSARDSADWMSRMTPQDMTQAQIDAQNYGTNLGDGAGLVIKTPDGHEGGHINWPGVAVDTTGIAADYAAEKGLSGAKTVGNVAKIASIGFDMTDGKEYGESVQQKMKDLGYSDAEAEKIAHAATYGYMLGYKLPVRGAQYGLEYGGAALGGGTGSIFPGAGTVVGVAGGRALGRAAGTTADMALQYFGAEQAAKDYFMQQAIRAHLEDQARSNAVLDASLAAGRKR
ncbi:MAG: hypothetical protein P4N59_18270 [Negativicutes bacterium]|nr:hypothetical protein [Negativicutes bacterium]